jgi:hypothetical protein
MSPLSFEALLKAREGTADFVDIPDFGFAMITGSGPPGGAEFTEARAGAVLGELRRALPGEEAARLGAQDHAT